MDYIKSIIFLIFFMILLVTLGKNVHRQGSFPLHLIYGYLVYSLIQMAGGVLAQLLKLDYLIYKIYMIIFVLIGIYLIYRESRPLFEQKDFRQLTQLIKKHASQYYLLYLFSFGLLCMALLMTNYMWVGNHQDDGWYLMKVAQAPYLGNQYDINYATGFPSSLGLVRSLNTFELDYAFWSNLLGIYPSVFCKVAMAYFHYFLTLCGFEELLCFLKQDKELPNCCLYFLLTVFIFALPSETLANHHLLTQQDGWHFSTAIWYGSGIVQSVGLLLLFIPLIHHKKLDGKAIGLFVWISLVLMSKASQALPLLALCGVLLVIGFMVKFAKAKKSVLGLIIALFAVIILLPGITPSYSEIQTYMEEAVKTYMSSPLVFGSIVIIVLFTYMMRDKKALVLWSSVLFALHLMIFVPGFNHLFLNTAIYTFVAGRTVTTLGFLTVISAGLYFGLCLFMHQMKTIWLKALYCLGATGILLVFLISHQVNIGLSNTLLLLKENPRLVPESTIELSKALAEIAGDSEMVVLSESWINCNHHHAHALATSLRIEATNIKVIAAIHRFDNMDEGIVYKNFDIDKQMVYEDFVEYYYVPEKIKKFRQLLIEYPVDLIVTSSSSAVRSLEANFDFKLIREINPINENFTYYVLKKQ